MPDMCQPYHALSEVDRIAELPEPVLRNLRITQSYHELSARLAERTGACANWCTFATWASKQAGQSIRREDLRRALDQVLAEAPEARAAVDDLVAVVQRQHGAGDPNEVRRLIRGALSPAAALERAGDAVGRGNQKVYAEIGRAFARFLEECPAGAASDEAVIARFCATLRPGDPPDGQEYLRRAFARYYRAAFSENAGEKAQLILTANLEIGFHEQTRLQPEIAEALEAAVVDPQDFSRRLLVALFPYRGWIAWTLLVVMRWFGRRTALDRAVENLLQQIRRRIRLFLTDHLMTLRFPHGRILRLGDDLRSAFPASLARPDNADLLALLAHIDPTPDSLRDSGAADWADLAERLHFIADLFRCSQEDPGLLEAPFTTTQVEEIKTGMLGEGEW